MSRMLFAIILLALCCQLLGGCATMHLLGAMGQNYEYQKQVEVLPEYTGWNLAT